MIEHNIMRLFSVDITVGHGNLNNNTKCQSLFEQVNFEAIFETRISPESTKNSMRSKDSGCSHKTKVE